VVLTSSTDLALGSLVGNQRAGHITRIPLMLGHYIFHRDPRIRILDITGEVRLLGGLSVDSSGTEITA